MDTHVITVCLGVILACTSLIANVLGYVLTEVRRPLFPFKPFTCWGCLAFWLTLSLGLVVGLEGVPKYNGEEVRVVAAYAVGGVSILFGLLNYLWVKSKYRIDE